MADSLVGAVDSCLGARLAAIWTSVVTKAGTIAPSSAGKRPIGSDEQDPPSRTPSA